jgi:hypothetical protein
MAGNVSVRHRAGNMGATIQAESHRAEVARRHEYGYEYEYGCGGGVVHTFLPPDAGPRLRDGNPRGRANLLQVRYRRSAAVQFGERNTELFVVRVRPVA